MITAYPYGDFYSSGNVAPVRASSSLSPLKPQRGRTDFKSYALLFVLMLSHVTATINPLGYFVITILFMLFILWKCFELFKKRTDTNWKGVLYKKKLRLGFQSEFLHAKGLR